MALFVLFLKGVRCPLDLSTYFRINQENTGQFERTLVIAEVRLLCELLRRMHGPHAR